MHKATHLLLAGLRQVLGDHVHQKGSNITPERARFDFSHNGTMLPEEKQAVEEYVNDAITASASMTIVDMSKDDAIKQGVEGSFWDRYPERVKVFVFKGSDGKTWSKELCGGPHAENTSNLSEFGKFKIIKEQSSAAGVRRIKAVLVK